MAVQYYIQLWSKDDGTGVFSHVTVPFGGAADAIGMSTKDNGPAWTGFVGVSGEGVTSANATGGLNLTDAPTAGLKHVITDVVISVDTAMLVTLREETTNKVLARFYMPANGTVQYTPRTPKKLSTALKKLQALASGAGNIAVTAHYYSEV